MAVRTPLKNDSGNLKEMSSAEVDGVVDQIVYQYSLNPSVALTVVSSGGNIGSITDTRKKAGAYSTRVDRFPTEAETAEPGTVTVTYNRIKSTSATVSPTTDTGKTWPVYYNSSGHIQAMSLQDVKDTFLHPAIDLLTTATTTSQQAGTYHISNSTSVTGSTLVSSTAVFSDTRANTSAYTSGGIPESLDQPTTVTSYYLHRVNGSDTSYVAPMFITSANHIQEYPAATWESLVQEWIRYTAASSTDGYAISYGLSASGSGNIRGSGMGDTRLNGSGNYQTRFVNTDDYRAQEFPNGTATTVNTYYLRIIKS